MVETIEFYEDEEEGLPAPLTRADVLILNKAQMDGEEPVDEGAAGPTSNGPVSALTCTRHRSLSQLTAFLARKLPLSHECPACSASSRARSQAESTWDEEESSNLMPVHSRVLQAWYTVALEAACAAEGEEE